MNDSIVLTGKKRLKAKENALGLTLAIIPIIGFVLFSLVPIIASLLVSFTNIKTANFELSEIVSLSLDNYIKIFTDEEISYKFSKSLIETFKYTLNVPITMLIGLVIAQLLTKISHGKRFFRTVFFIPYVCSIVAVSLAWRMMYETEYGIINTMLSFMGFCKVEWLTSEKTFNVSVIIMSVWSKIGFCVILYQAALNNVNKEYYEASAIDGASFFHEFFFITIPMISSTTFYLLTMKLISSLQMMTESQIMAGNELSPPGLSGFTTVYYIYNMAFVNSTQTGFGLAAASSWVLTSIIFVITVLNFKLSEKWVFNDD